MSLRARMRRLQNKAGEGAVFVHQKDGTVKVFGTMEVHQEMFLAQCDLLRDTARESEVLEAVRNATPESRAAFEERFGPIVITVHIIAAEYNGGWLDVLTLTEEGRAERVRHEGGSEEAERIRRQARGESYP